MPEHGPSGGGGSHETPSHSKVAGEGAKFVEEAIFNPLGDLVAGFMIGPFEGKGGGHSKSGGGGSVHH